MNINFASQALLLQGGIFTSLRPGSLVTDFPFKFNSSLNFIPFSGCILIPELMKLNPNDSDCNFSGCMSDGWGPSTLNGIVVTEKEIAFSKSYRDRKDSIRFVLKNQRFPGYPNIWTGKYEGSGHVGHGDVNCLITPVPHQFLKNYLG